MINSTTMVKTWMTKINISQALPRSSMNWMKTKKIEIWITRESSKSSQNLKKTLMTMSLSWSLSTLMTRTIALTNLRCTMITRSLSSWTKSWKTTGEMNIQMIQINTTKPKTSFATTRTPAVREASTSITMDIRIKFIIMTGRNKYMMNMITMNRMASTSMIAR